MATRRAPRTKRNRPSNGNGTRRAPRRATARAAAARSPVDRPSGARKKAGRAPSKPRPGPSGRSIRTPRPPALIGEPGEGIPNGIGLETHHLDFTSHDIESVKRFYTGILGFRRFHHDPRSNHLTVATTPTSSIGFMPPPSGPPEQWRPPREPSTYFMVADVDRVCDGLRRRGITMEQEPTDMPWGHRVAVTRDPEGRAVCLAQVLKR
jgi:predicted enzyme related to lactoylglutathione lyase